MRYHESMKLFVWDLHGTLEKGNEDAVIELSNMALEQLGYDQRFQARDSRDLYGLKWYEYFERLLPDESHEKHMELQVRSFQLSDQNQELIARYMRPSAHAHEVLQHVADSSHEQILISNTVPSTIPLFVKALAMEPYFSGANAFSVDAHTKDAMRSKEQALDAYLQDKSFEDIIVIGDSSTDLRLAEHARAKAYLYAHPGYAFRADGGDYRIHDLREVIRQI